MVMLAIIRFIGFLKVGVLKTIIAIRELGSISYIHTYIRLLTTSPKGLFSANYIEKDKNKNIYKLFKVTIANH